jgi:hypothetical protein
METYKHKMTGILKRLAFAMLMVAGIWINSFTVFVTIVLYVVYSLAIRPVVWIITGKHADTWISRFMQAYIRIDDKILCFLGIERID